MPLTGAVDEDAIIDEIRSGNADAYESLVDLHARALRAFIALRVPVPHLINEIAHEAFVFAYRNLDGFERGTSFGAWLRAIAHNLIRRELQQHARTRANQQNYFENLVIEKSAELFSDGRLDAVEHLRECVGHLPARLALLVRERYENARSADQLADMFGQSSAWVRTTLCRVRHQLRDCVERRLAQQPG